MPKYTGATRYKSNTRPSNSGRPSSGPRGRTVGSANDPIARIRSRRSANARAALLKSATEPLISAGAADAGGLRRGDGRKKYKKLRRARPTRPTPPQGKRPARPKNIPFAALAGR